MVSSVLVVMIFLNDDLLLTMGFFLLNNGLGAIPFVLVLADNGTCVVVLMNNRGVFRFHRCSPGGRLKPALPPSRRE